MGNRTMVPHLSWWRRHRIWIFVVLVVAFFLFSSFAGIRTFLFDRNGRSAEWYEQLARARSVCNPETHICTRRLTFDEVKLILEGGQPEYLSRLKEDQELYTAARLNLTATYMNMSDAVRHHKFRVPCVESEGKLRCEFLAGRSGGDAVALKNPNILPDSVAVPNDFPYALDPSILHEVIWTRVPLYDDLIRVERLVERHFPKEEYETLYLVNPKSLQTIKDIFHIHVFARRIEVKGDQEVVDG